MRDFEEMKTIAMIWRTVPIVCLCLCMHALAHAAELTDTIAKVKPAIVGVGTVQYTRRPPGKFVGTGFAVADGKHIITNAHILPDFLDTEKNEFLAVLTQGKKERIRKAKIVKFDRVHDLALLSIAGKPLSALRVSDSRDVKEGRLYAFTGFPIGMVLGMYPVTHRGIVSAITPIAVPQLASKRLNPKMIRRLREPYSVFQLDATAYPGNSGSPLYDPANGEVVGVINKVFVKETKENVLEKPSGITYAIPVRHVTELLRNAGIAGK